MRQWITSPLEAKHPELSKAPLALWGVSAGSNVSERYCSQFAKRVAAFASSTGTCGPGSLAPGKTDIPMFFAIGAKDKPEWVQDSQRNIDAGLKLHAPWALAFNKNAGHGTGRSLDVIIPFLKATVNMRFAPPAATGASTGGAPSIFKTQPSSFSQSGSKSAAQPPRFTKSTPAPAGSATPRLTTWQVIRISRAIRRRPSGFLTNLPPAPGRNTSGTEKGFQERPRADQDIPRIDIDAHHHANDARHTLG